MLPMALIFSASGELSKELTMIERQVRLRALRMKPV